MRALRRVAVTGMGIVSCLGNRLDDVSRALRAGHGGIRHNADFAAHGLKSTVSAAPVLTGLPEISRRHRRFMGDTALQAHAALHAAIEDAGLRESDVRDPGTGLIAGSGVGSLAHYHQAMYLADQGATHKISPFAVPQVMGSTVSATLSTAFGITGASYSLTSACATSAHCIGHGMELIQLGKQDIVFAGGAEELHWTTALLFDAMGALSTAFNTQPERASRPYDADRDGFVIAGGAGMLVLEDLEHAQKRGARIYAELVGYGASSDGQDMLTPSVSGAARAMNLATASLDIPLDYVNTHATSTKAGDLVEIEAMRLALGPDLPAFSSTKGLTGHPIGAAAVHEAIYTLLMMRDGFVAACANLAQPDAQLDAAPIVRQTESRAINAAMSNSFGFGGTNACLAFRRMHH